MIIYFSTTTIKARRHIFKVLRESNCQDCIAYVVKSSIKNNSKLETFSDRKKKISLPTNSYKRISGWCSSEKEKNSRRKIQELKISTENSVILCRLGKTRQILTVKEINNKIQFVVLKIKIKFKSWKTMMCGVKVVIS